MEKKPFNPHAILITLCILTVLALATTVDVTVTNEAGIRVELPDQLGEWTGDEARFCQNLNCLKSQVVSKLTDRDVCPECGGALASMTRMEVDSLPKDTVVLKKNYVNPAGEKVFVSIVLSGSEAASIHRPQICLVGQGNEIIREHPLKVPVAGNSGFKVMVLDLIKRVRIEGRLVEYPSFYAYWFVGKGRETHSHIQRMIWMATDRIFFNRAHRWAYISIAGGRDPDTEHYRELIRRITSLLHPALSKN